MFSPLALSITELLEFPCVNLEEGCQVKLKKREIVEHEKEACIYREKLQCLGCERMIAGFTFPDHFKDCGNLRFLESRQSVLLDESQNPTGDMVSVGSIRPIVYKLEKSKNRFILGATTSG